MANYILSTQGHVNMFVVRKELLKRIKISIITDYVGNEVLNTLLNGTKRKLSNGRISTINVYSYGAKARSTLLSTRPNKNIAQLGRSRYYQQYRRSNKLERC